MIPFTSAEKKKQDRKTTEAWSSVRTSKKTDSKVKFAKVPKMPSQKDKKKQHQVKNGAKYFKFSEDCDAQDMNGDQNDNFDNQDIEGCHYHRIGRFYVPRILGQIGTTPFLPPPSHYPLTHNPSSANYLPCLPHSYPCQEHFFH